MLLFTVACVVSLLLLIGWLSLLSSETALKFKFLKKPVQLVLSCNLEKVIFSIVSVSDKILFVFVASVCR